MRSYWVRVSGLHAAGDLACEVGHRLRLPDGAVDGIFAGWRWTGTDLVVEQDRYGFFPLFEWRSPDARVVSTDLLTLLEQGAPPALDLDALSVFVRVGFFVGADTPFRSIRAVLPGPLRHRTLGISRAEAIDGYLDLFRTAIARRRPAGPFAMPLSGGRDSRHILLALRDAGHVPGACVTVRHFPPRANDDEAVARELCGRLGVAHHVILQPADRAAVERRKNVSTHFCTDEHAQFVVLADYLRAHTRETYDGIAGDVLSQSSYLRPPVHQLFEAGDLRAVAEFILDGYGTMTTEGALARVLASPMRVELARDRAIARLTAGLAPHAGAANPIGSFFLANRTRREIALAPYALMRDLRAWAPYLDRDLYDFLAALPAPLLMDRTLHTEAIARGWPEYADIPYERKGLVEKDRWAARRLAAALTRTVTRGAPREWLRTSGLLPGMLATLFDGNAARLWHAPLLLYLDQIAAAAAAATAARRDR